ncbi:hypothetical protein AAE02nite_49900 [Adhaeribacter aerolatus]|uniref:Toxin RelE n=1 Tax=Adhaeribacter aerolatus TaxID=670289 RepID=A0A512B5T0_9BACT|nr:type II toxin-antitoxin system RelE/ParE family toxin [Adhaeribacter aerolatus]GEO07326.1 hypothetical protein AAE02nite_49900 [Adhaeribacter aerolatus]
MKNIQRVEYEEEAIEFLDSLSHQTREKLFVLINRTEQGIEGPWFKKLRGQKNLYEFRMSADNTWYRLFAFYSKEEKSLIICINGFQKKQNATPKQEIDRAEKLRKFYGGG